MQNNQIQLFENRKIRSQWNDDDERWYFSVVDVVAVLTDQENARSASTYWAVLKKRLISEGADQLLTNCKQLRRKNAAAKPLALKTQKNWVTFNCHSMSCPTMMTIFSDLKQTGSKKTNRGEKSFHPYIYSQQNANQSFIITRLATLPTITRL